MKKSILLSRVILKADISDRDKLNLLSSLLCGDDLLRDNAFTIKTQSRALELKAKVVELMTLQEQNSIEDQLTV